VLDLRERTVLAYAGRPEDFATRPSLIVRQQDREVAVFRLKEAYVAVDNRCLHDGGSVGEGVVRSDIVTCPRHHGHYRLRTGEVVGQPGRRLRCYPVEIYHNQVTVRLPRRRIWTGLERLLRRLTYVGDDYSVLRRRLRT
jgi:nitrite reductase/ring-hydroxylating ferredoxin subunit